MRVLSVAVLVVGGVAAGARIEIEGGDGKMMEELRGKVDAARVEQLLSRRGDERVAVDEGGWVSVATAVEAMGKGLEGEYRRLFDGEARKAMERLKEEKGVEAERFYELARRYGLSSVAAGAFVEAGDRAALGGDAGAASCFYGLAKGKGWAADAERARVWAVCRMLNDETGGEVPAEAGKSGVELAVKLAGYRGPAVFEASWYGKIESVGTARYFPVACDGVVYVAGARDVLAIKENGGVLWRWASGEVGLRGVDRGGERGRGTNYGCGVFAGAGGAQVVVVRQPKAAGQDSCLRAMRAGDGKLLWTTETRREYDRLSIAGSAAVVGRYVYAVAVDFAEEAKLVLVGADLMDGHVLFKTVLGKMPDMGRRREERMGWDDFWEQTEPAVSGDRVVVTPNVGVAFCMDRFNGKLRWARVYRKSEEAADGRRGRGAGRPVMARRPGELNELLRWRGTPVVCENVVVMAPQDTAGAWGLEAKTGRVIWAERSAAEWCLTGGNEAVGVFAGTGVVGVEAGSGKVKWRYEPGGGVKVSGPVVVAGGVVLAPVADGRVVGVLVESGKAGVGKARWAGIRQILASPAARKVVEEAGVLAGFKAMPTAN